MRKLAQVEEAKSLFSEAKEWSMWKWLTEKGRARRTADAAWEALEAYEGEVRQSWSDDVQRAWRGNHARVDPEIKQAVQALKEADAEANQARIDAEAHFDEADRRLSTSMACEGAQMAIDAWVMREKVIRKEEALRKK